MFLTMNPRSSRYAVIVVWSALLTLCGACSLTFDNQAEDVVLEEGPGVTVRRLNDRPIDAYTFLHRPDRDWLLLRQDTSALTALSLPDLGDVHQFQAAQVLTGSEGGLALIDEPAPEPGARRQVRLGCVDEPPQRLATFSWSMSNGRGEDVFAIQGCDRMMHFVARSADKTLRVIERPDRIFELEWPKGSDPGNPGGRTGAPSSAPRWISQDAILQATDEGAGQLLRYFREGPGGDIQLSRLLPDASRYLGAGPGVLLFFGGDRLWVFDVAERRMRALADPIRLQHAWSPLRWRLLPEERRVLVCSGDGLRSLSYNDPPAPSLVLDPAPCAELQPIPEERWPACAPPIRLTDTRTIEGAPEVSAGWIGDWRFMERGRDVQVSADCRRVRFMEYAERSDGLGELRSVSLADRRVLRVGRDAAWYAELPDGRLVAMTQRLGPLRAARLLLVDEDTGRGRQLVDNPLFAESDAPQLSNPAYYPIEHLSWLRSGLLAQRRWGTGMELLYVPIPPR